MAALPQVFRVSSLKVSSHYLSRYERRRAPGQTYERGLVKRTDITINTVVPPPHPAARDRTQICTTRQFADINKDLIVGRPGVSSEGGGDKNKLEAVLSLV